MSFPPEHEGAQVRPSPNFGERRGVDRPDAVVLHYTGMATGQGAEDRLCDPASEVSSHYVVHEDGRIVQLVREADRAWHAGASRWAGQDDLNSRSIGIEIVNIGHGPDPALGHPGYPPVQIEALAALLRGIMARHAIAPARVLGHSDVAPGRKIDPGEGFPWPALAAKGLALQVDQDAPADGGEALRPGDEGEPVAVLQRKLAAVGYWIEPSGVFEARTKAVLEAFQRRHRPARVDGIADASTRAVLDRLVMLLKETVAPSLQGAVTTG